MKQAVYSHTVFSFVWESLRPHKWSLLCLFFCSFTWAIDSTFWPLFFRFVINELVTHESARQTVWEGLKWILLYGALLWILIETGFRAQGFLMARLLPKIEADMRMRAFDFVQHHSPQYFSDRFSGNLANKITDITTQVPALLQQLFYSFIPTIASFFLASFFMWLINPWISLTLLTGIIIHLSICFIFTKKCEELENIHSGIRSSLLGKIVDSFTNTLSVNLFFNFKHEYALVAHLQEQERKTNYEAKRYVEIMKLFFGLFTFLIGGLAINGLMVFLWIHDRVSTGEVAQIFNTTGNLILAMWYFSMSIPQAYQSIGIARQALSILNDPPDVTDQPRAKPVTVTQGEIIFEKVHFHYGENRLFLNKDVHIRGGEKIGLVGYSGSGKSTFVALILRMFPLRSGKILIDGQNIAQRSLQSLRSQIALIPQDPTLFHRSLVENIRYGKPDASMEEVIQAAQRAHCDEFIQRLPLGYDTEVGERGTKLSGGERQRIAIARALLVQPPVLILDEATSALDSVTEKYIHESLMDLMEHRTSIVIAHRLSTLAEMDRLLVFDRGKIIETGTHSELLAKGGHYARMWSTQAQGFLPDKPNE